MTAWYQGHTLSASDESFVAHPFLNRQLIAYIGNKRRVLGFLYGIFRRLEERAEIRSFVDPFAGTGSVARLARLMGYRVWANDWEEYSRIINSAYLQITPAVLSRLYPEDGGIGGLLSRLNGLGGKPPKPFISRHFAPKSTEGADYRSERLFYTRENALFLDRVRQRIEELYPPEDIDERKLPERELLIALLLYEASTHANTSGVFKAFHKGYGGHGKDALRRITSPMELELPVLVEGTAPAFVGREDAAAFLRRRSFDLCYLDPPYNGHQYGSNYHLLNSLARWDFPEVDESRSEDGILQSKGGIRTDWNETRSPFCSRRTAPRALRELVEAADCRFLVLSYNSEGIIPLEDLIDLLSSYGEVEISTLDYVKYRGGRQSLSRKVHNVEFQLLLHRSEEVKPLGRRISAERFLLLQRILSLFREAYVPERIKAEMERAGARCEDDLPSGSPLAEFSSRMKDLYRFIDVPSFEELETLSAEELTRLDEVLSGSTCRDRREEFRVLLGLISQDAGRGSEYERRLLDVVKKFAHKKYRREWESAAAELTVFLQARPEAYSVLRKGFEELQELAELRFNG